MGTEVIAPEETETVKPTELEEKIIRQVEYYFGNYNLSKDKFLKNEIQNDEGWVSLETMIKFNRLKQLTDDFTAISEALKKSPNQLMEVNDDCTKIRRKVPLPEKSDKNELDERTLYVKGFGKNGKLDEILEFFKGHNVENVFMRRKKTGKNNFVFKGSVFATFETKEDSEKYLNITGQKFQKMELLKEKKKDYVKRKDTFYENLRAEKAKKIAEKKEDVIKSKGCLLRLSDLGDTEIARKDIKETLESFGKVAFVDFHDGQGQEKAIVRFEKSIVEDILKEAEEVDGEKKIEINSIKVTASLIDGEEEEKYLDVVARNRAASKARGNHQGNRGRFDKKPRGKPFHKRNRDDDEDRRPNKKVKKDNEPEDREGSEIPSQKTEEAGEKIKSENDGTEPPAKKVKKEENTSEESAEKSNTTKEKPDVKDSSESKE